MQLACAMITAPRAVSYLGITAQSLVAAGVKHVCIFAEPESPLADLDKVRGGTFSLVQRLSRHGHFRNWMGAARSLLDSDAELILICEDDAKFGRTAIAESLAAWPKLGYPGFLSLYTPSHYQRTWRVLDSDGKQLPPAHETAAAAVKRARRIAGATVKRIDAPVGLYCPQFREMYGTVGLLFARKTLAEIIDHPIAQNWQAQYPNVPEDQLACTDLCLGRIVRDLQLNTWYFNPGRAQHIGEVSIINPHAGLSPKRRSHNVRL